MTRFSKSVLLMGTAVLALAACSGVKGPGAIGTKEDIVVRNNGLPGEAKAPPPGSDIAASGEQGAGQALAMPPASVEQGQPVAPVMGAGEPLPDTSPAMEQAVQQEQDSKAPLPSTANTPTADADPIGAPDAPATQTPTNQTIIPEESVTDVTTPPPYAPMPTPAPVDPMASAPTVAPQAPAPSYAPVAPAPVAVAPAPSSVYPAEDYVAGAPAVAAPAPAMQMPAPAPAPSPNAYVPVPAGTAYPLDPNAPYSPKAMAGVAGAAAPDLTMAAAPVSATGLNLSDPALIRSAQAALKTKGGYTGAESGQIDAAFLNALTIYQGANGLPQGGLNEATLRQLGVIE